MLADCMAADGSTQEPYLRHILSSSQSPYQARYRAPSPQAYRGDYPQQHSQNHLRQPHTTFNYTNGYSVQHDEYSPQYWPSGGMDSSPESLARHQQAFAQVLPLLWHIVASDFIIATCERLGLSLCERFACCSMSSLCDHSLIISYVPSYVSRSD